MTELGIEVTLSVGLAIVNPLPIDSRALTELGIGVALSVGLVSSPVDSPTLIELDIGVTVSVGLAKVVSSPDWALGIFSL